MTDDEACITILKTVTEKRCRGGEFDGDLWDPVLLGR
jgi:hypothetical protein